MTAESSASLFSTAFGEGSRRFTLEISVRDGKLRAALLKNARLPLAELADLFSLHATSASASLLRGCHQALLGDVYEASAAFSDFLPRRDPRFDSGLRHSAAGTVVFIHERPLAGDAATEISPVLALVAAFCADAPPRRRAPPLIEALALAAARAECVAGNPSAAHTVVQRLLALDRGSILLRAAETAIGLMLKQAPVPPHLAKFVGPDPHALADRFCPVPFARADIHQHGGVLMCCSHWLPTEIGNVFESTTDEILNSDTARAIRRSVVDGSFKYCSHTDCELIANNKLPRKADYAGKAFEDEHYRIEPEVLKKAFALESFDIPNISYLIFCLDRTCNLSCPSCRADVIMVKGEERDRLYDATERGVLPMLRNAKRVMINPSGEAFLSRPSRRLLEHLAEPGHETLKVDIITNGTLCDKAEWDKFSHLYGRIGYVRVSIDGATKGVIEKLRRGTKFEPLVENLTNIARMHKAGLIESFFVSFTYQRDNLREMPEFLDFSRSFGVSTVIFERLQNVGAFTPAEYSERAVHLVDHPLHHEFIRTARQVKKDARVYLDFDPR